MVKINGLHTSGDKMLDMDKFVFPKIKTLFKKDPSTKLVIPELNDDCEWVREGAGLITIKIDGVNVKVKVNHSGKPTPYKQLKGYNSSTYVIVSEHDVMDKPIWEAFQNLSNKESGFYEAYGPGINGNPHGAERNLMVKILPIGGALMVSASHKGLRLKRGRDISVQDFYDSVQAELAESPEIEGIVFHLEQPSMHPIKWAKIKRRDFGLQWPPVKPLSSDIVMVN